MTECALLSRWFRAGAISAMVAACESCGGKIVDRAESSPTVDASDVGALSCDVHRANIGPRVGGVTGHVAAPGPSGGAILDGTYVLVRLLDHGPREAVPEGVFAETFRIESGVYEWSEEVDGTSSTLKGRVATEGDLMSLSVGCPAGRSDLVMLYGVTLSGFWTCISDGTTCLDESGFPLRQFTRAP